MQISVLITAYNREKFISEAIDSVLSSTYQSFELIIVDDCSEDATFQLAKHYETVDTRVKVYKNEKNVGQFANRNKAATYANGVYLKYVDSDDKISPDALQKMVEAVEKNPGAGIGLVCNREEILSAKSNAYPCLNPGTAFLWHYLNGGILFPGPTGCIYKKDVFLKIGGFPLDLGINGDVYLNLKMASLSSVVLFPGNLVFWRKHAGQVDELQKDYPKMHKERFLLNRRILEEENPVKTKKHLRQLKLTCKVLFLRGVLLNLLLKGKLNTFWQILKETDVSFLELPKSLIPLRLLNFDGAMSEEGKIENEKISAGISWQQNR